MEGLSLISKSTLCSFPMNSKRGPRNFYKGKGAINLGFLDNKGQPPCSPPSPIPTPLPPPLLVA